MMSRLGSEGSTEGGDSRGAKPDGTTRRAEMDRLHERQRRHRRLEPEAVLELIVREAGADIVRPAEPFAAPYSKPYTTGSRRR